MTKILAVDDNQEALFALEALLRDAGYEVITAASGTETIAKITAENPDLVLLDVVMPRPDGYEVTAQVKADPVLRYIPIVLLTSKDSLDDVIHGLEQGADDYIKKPFRKEELLARVHAVLRTRQLYQELRDSNRLRSELQQRLSEKYNYANIVGRSAKMKALFETLEKVKDAEVPVLVSGESGTGKELVATALHYSSRRREKSLVVQNCSAFNENLLESELFGHVKGAFSGALKDKQGLFEIADGGTFFLDELGEMSLALQARLLRVLEDGSFIPVGATHPKKVDVRIVAATNRNLKEMVSKGTFREDLFYRLNVVPIELPPLRERREDIPHLVEHFLALVNSKRGSAKVFSPEALEALCDYGWPGNIRELRNEIERATLLSSADCIGAEALSPQILSAKALGAAGSAGTLGAAVQDLEKKMLLSTLTRLAWNKSEAARELGISRSSLIAKVQAFGLEQGSKS
ncbi:MAG: sigma-54 dependent transcriptional regulator [Oligoflexia bacterium]|nr:sigma-54 dependent transcriptional regulator [Oligoflexia bacterium]